MQFIYIFDVNVSRFASERAIQDRVVTAQYTGDFIYTNLLHIQYMKSYKPCLIR